MLICIELNAWLVLAFRRGRDANMHTWIYRLIQNMCIYVIFIFVNMNKYHKRMQQRIEYNTKAISIYIYIYFIM